MNLTDKTIAKSISVILHPVLLPLYGFLLLFYFEGYFLHPIPAKVKQYLLLVVGLNSLLLPLGFLYIMKRRKLISSFAMETRAERFYPLLLFLLFYFSSWFLISRIPLLYLFARVFFLAGITTFVALGLNFFLKISLHSLGIASLAGAIYNILLAYSFEGNILLTTVIFLSGITAASRLILQAHRPYEVYAGLISGFLLGVTVF